MMVHQRFICHLTLCICLILSISVNHASAQNTKCEKEAGAIENFTLHKAPKTMSDDRFFSLKGEETQLKDFAGDAILLNHWAMWCAPCIREMPSILRLSQKVKGKNITVIPLSMDRVGVKKTAQFVKKKNWLGANFYNNKKMTIARKSHISGIPATQILNKEGLEIGRLVGTYEWDSQEVVDLLSCLARI